MDALLIAGVFAVFIGAAVLAIRSNMKRSEALQELARARGWAYSRSDTLGLTARVEALFRDVDFDLSDVMVVESGDRKMHLFECAYGTGARRGKHFGAAILIESDRFRTVGSQMEILERVWSDALLLADQVEMEDSEFAQSFIVQSKDPAAAKRVAAHAPVQRLLVEHLKAPLHNPVRIALGPSGAVLLTALHAEPERWFDLVELARRLESALP